MNPFRSVGARLSLALLVVVAAALGLVYVVVVPQLENRLVHGKISQLKGTAQKQDAVFKTAETVTQLGDLATETAIGVNGRVVVYGSLSPPVLQVLADSNPVQARDVQSDPIAVRAATTRSVQSGTAERRGQRYAEVAAPVAGTNEVVLYTAPLTDSLSDVRLVQRRLLWAGLVALLLSLALGYGGASIFTRRIRRLERAADRIAAGRFDEPVEDAGADELGQLAQAFERMRRRLAHLDRARREFIANASHELRTPVFSLGGFLELLTEEELDDETRAEFLATMREQVERLAGLATDLLDLSRIDAGRMHVEAEELDLSVLARALSDEFAAVALASEHPLAVDADGPVPVSADEERVLRIGRALVENAIRHTPPGTNVAVRASSRNGSAVLTVEDDGPGIPEDETQQLFERFYRLDGGRSSGSGLGLAIARELAELMGGGVELVSSPGSTAFRVTLPAGTPEPESFSRENDGVARSLQ
jgi:signal transduction histidine kinase